MYKILCKDGRAKRAEFQTVHGTVQTPLFMNVGTAAAIKGAVATTDLKDIGCQIELSNTYHLHVRPGDKIVKQMGGLHKFMYWDRPILTDSGGFQVFSLAGLRKIKEEGVTFNSHVDGRKIFMGPEESMQIQSNLASTIAMAFDECAPALADRQYVENSVARTARWLVRCKNEMERLNSLPDTINKNQLLFGINQGAIYEDIRIDHAKRISELDLPGYAIGGLAVGETAEQMYHILDVTVPYLPEDRPTYLMGVGTNATVMMVENAERFGLAQLHQLRGRVGRGNLQSYCIFMSGKKDKDTMERLNVLEKSNDGFYIAGEDLKMRGPGDFFGIRQSGELMFKVGDIYNHADMLRAAQDVYDRYGQEIDAKLINKGDDRLYTMPVL